MEPIRKAELLIGPLLLVNNLIIFLVNKTGTNIIINMTIPLLIIIMSLIKKDRMKKYAISALFFIIGSLIAFYGAMDNFSAISLFVISCFVLKNKIFYIISSFLIFILTLLNFSIHELPISSFLNMISAYIFIAYVSVYLFWPVSEIRAKIGLKKGLTYEQIQTVEMMLKGKSHTEAAKDLCIERATYSARIATLKKRYNVTNEVQLTISLIQDKIISVNQFAIAKTEENDLLKPL